MFVWFLIAVGLVVIVAMAWFGRRQYGRPRQGGTKAATNRPHRGSGRRNHRGRGKRR